MRRGCDGKGCRVGIERTEHRLVTVALGLLSTLVVSCTSPSAAPGSSAAAANTSISAVRGPALSPPTRPSLSLPTATLPSTPGPPRSVPPARTTSAVVAVTVTSTVTSTHGPVTTTVGPPKATAEPAPIVGDCPYLSADVVSSITGQHHGQTELVAFRPHPTCVFRRSDGGRLGTVRVIQAASPLAAVAAVNQHVPIADSLPVSQPSGWLGGSMTTGKSTQDSSAGSVYGVSKGNIAVIVRENESPSLKARLMAVCAIYGLKLQAGEPPELCSES